MTRAALVALALLLATAGPVMAQYVFDPNADDEQGPGAKFFGSAKDQRGALLPGVTITIAHAYTLVTDAQGRFRGIVNVSGVSTVGCSKPGYELLRVNKRPGPKGVRETVQIDCVFKSAR
jgi:hypothetical protein